MGILTLFTTTISTRRRARAEWLKANALCHPASTSIPSPLNVTQLSGQGHRPCQLLANPKAMLVSRHCPLQSAEGQIHIPQLRENLVWAPGSSGSVPGATIAADVHSAARWTTTSVGACRAGGRDRPLRSRHGAERDPRGGLRVKEELRRRMHQPIPRQGEWLQQVVAGYFAYHAVPTGIRALQTFRDCVVRLWRRSLRRRGRRDKTTWKRIKRAEDFLPKPRILHPWPG